MQKIKENIVALSLFLTVPGLNVFYKLLNSSNRNVYSLMTDIDRGIPFVKYFIVPYVVWYLYIIMTFLYLCFKDKRTYYRALIAADIGMVICYLTYLVYQTTVPRPELLGNDIFTKMVGLIYSIDPPYNCFPSIHCITCYVLMVAMHNSKVKNTKNIIIVDSVGIIIMVSTLFVKQHVIMDVFSAILLGGITFKIVNIFDMDKAVMWFRRKYAQIFPKNKFDT